MSIYKRFQEWLKQRGKARKERHKAYILEVLKVNGGRMKHSTLCGLLISKDIRVTSRVINLRDEGKVDIEFGENPPEVWICLKQS